ncbi:MAG: helix-turn-helix transcriptional regulator [Gammaproteobacteria bacterium]|nr:helix-turn-helix transcriptional regulator [Gammaproteobacteria bacterium]
MQSKFESAEWIDAVAGIIGSTKGKAAAASMTDAIAAVVEHEGTALIAFHKDARPDVLHHTLEPAGRKHYLERYLDGPYLLDPLYALALRSKQPTLCRFREELPDRFRSSEYYRQYCERTHLLDEIDYVLPVSRQTTVVLVVGRRTKMFSKAELHRLELIEPLVLASLQRIWHAWVERTGDSKGRDDVHRRLTECFDNFGQSVLTRRERQISQLLLRGHSSKSVARELKIAPGTVMVHKRNLFAKLGISSQYELFSLLIDDLSSL